MNRKTIWCLALLFALVVSPAALAKVDFETAFSISRVGPLLYQAPEELIVNQDMQFSSFVITWEPIDNIYAYHIGVLQDVLDKKGQNYYRVMDGWFGSGIIKDGLGQEHHVAHTFFDSIELPGSATKVDIGPILHLFEEEAAAYQLLGTYVIFTIVPMSGAPVSQFIELPAR